MAALLPTPEDCCEAQCCTEVDATTLEAAVAAIGCCDGAIDTIPLLRAVTDGLTNNRFRMVLGDAVKGDGGGGGYYYDSTDLTTDDGISTLKPDILGVLDAGRWKKLF